MKVAIVGSREWDNPREVEAYVEARLANVHHVFGDKLILVSGGAPGVDTWAAEAAERRGVPVEVIRPRWRVDGVYNPRAGFERNEDIVKGADLVIVVWNGESRGSKNDIDHALRYRKPLQVHFPE